DANNTTIASENSTMEINPRTSAVRISGTAVFAAPMVSCNSAFITRTRVLTNSLNSSLISAMIDPRLRSSSTRTSFTTWLDVTSLMTTPPDAKCGTGQKAGDRYAHDYAHGMLLRQPVHPSLGPRYEAVLRILYPLQRRTCFTGE